MKRGETEAVVVADAATVATTTAVRDAAHARLAAEAKRKLAVLVLAEVPDAHRSPRGERERKRVMDALLAVHSALCEDATRLEEDAVIAKLGVIIEDSAP
jgi:hypothetical protein